MVTTSDERLDVCSKNLKNLIRQVHDNPDTIIFTLRDQLPFRTASGFVKEGRSVMEKAEYLRNYE